MPGFRLRSIGGFTTFRGRALSDQELNARAERVEKERAKNKQRGKSRRANREK